MKRKKSILRRGNKKKAPSTTTLLDSGDKERPEINTRLWKIEEKSKFATPLFNHPDIVHEQDSQTVNTILLFYWKYFLLSFVEKVPSYPRASVPVICANTEALFLLNEKLVEIEVNGERKSMTPNQFEDFAGLEYMKKWASSIRVREQDGNNLQSIGNYLKQYQDKQSPQIATSTEEETIASTESEELQPTVKSERKVDGQSISYPITDKSFMKLLGTSDDDVILPPTLKTYKGRRGLHIVDYRGMTEPKVEAFMREAIAQKCLWKAKRRSLAVRKSLFSGFDAETPRPAVVNSIGRKRRNHALFEEKEALKEVKMEMEEEDEEMLLFEMLDAAVPLSFHDFHLTLSQLYHRVEEFGGYEAVMSAKGWDQVAQNLYPGMNPRSTEKTEVANWLERTFTQILLPLHHLMHENENPSSSMSSMSQDHQ